MLRSSRDERSRRSDNLRPHFQQKVYLDLAAPEVSERNSKLVVVLKERVMREREAAERESDGLLQCGSVNNTAFDKKLNGMERKGIIPVKYVTFFF